MTTRRRRTSILLPLLLAATLVLTACGGSAGGSGGGSSAGGSTVGYPLTLKTQYGKLTLKQKPERIVVLGSPLDVDMLNALGEPPVAFGFGGGGEKSALSASPWLTTKSYGTYDDALFDDSYKPAREAIAAQRPDLIIFFGASVPLDKTGYEQLSEVAPTYAYEQVPPWRDELATLGKITGKSAQAKQATTKIESELAQARREIPGLQGRTFFHGVANPQGLYSVPAVDQVFAELGLTPSTSQPKPSDGPKFLSPENLDEVDADVVFLGGEGPSRDALEKDPRFKELPSVKNDAMVLLQPLLDDVTIPSQIGPASVPWLLERLIPELQKSPLSKGE